MQNYMRTILSGLQNWINKRLHETVPETDKKHQQLVTNTDGKTVWENKTHYSRGMGTEILAEETEISITNDGETEGPILNTSMVHGKIYEIILNGISYNCKASTAYAPMGNNGEMIPCIIFGDFTVFEGSDYVSIVDMSASNPDVPFTSMAYPASLTGLAGDLVFLQINDSTLFETTGTIEIKHTYEDIEKLPYKYIYTPDQNAKETENGYIKNRTHWIEQDDNAIIMAETTLTNTGDEFVVSTPWVNNIIAGETYTIIYNGVSYISPAVGLGTQIGLPGATILGDASLFDNSFTGGNPNAPFCILCVPNAYASNAGFSAVMADKNGLTEITVAIFGTGEKVHKLDSKFIDWPSWYPEIIAEDANTYSGSVTSTQFGDNYSGTFDHFEPADRRIYAIRFNNSATTIDCVCEYYPGDMDLPAFYSFSNLIGQATFQIQCYDDSAKKSAIISTFKVDEISFENPRQITFPIRGAFVEGTLKGFRNGKDSNGRMNYSVCGIGANSTLGNASLAVGNYASASGSYSIAYGEYCQANGLSSAAFNNGKAKVSYAFAANSGTASGLRSASFNDSSTTGETSVSFNTSSASGKNQLTFGKHNIKDTESKYIMIAGNGSGTGSESNAATIAWDGTAWFKGDIKVGGTGQDDENATTLVTQAYVDSPKNYIALTDTVTGQLYHITIENGNLVSTLVEGGE